MRGCGNQGAGKNPMTGQNSGHRHAALLVASLAVVLPAPVRAEESAAHPRAVAAVWDEAVVVQRAQAVARATADAAVAVADADRVATDQVPNPSLQWDRTQVGGPGGGAEDAVALRWPLDLSGGRAARRAAARAGVAQQRAAAAVAVSDAVARALGAYWDAIHEAGRARVLAAHQERTAEAARIVQRREAAGTGSGFERLRLDLEAERARGVAHQAAADAAVQRSALVADLGGGEADIELGDALDGAADLAAAGTPAGVVAPVGAPERRAVALAADARSLAEVADRAAGSAGGFGVSVAAGVRIDSGTTSRFGYVAGVVIDLPVLSKGDDLRAAARARLQAADAALAALERASAGPAVRARTELHTAVAELRHHDAATSAQVQRLVAAAQSGYRDGQRALVDVIDAHRVQVDTELRHLELAWRARRAWVALRAATGAFE
ncbi:MAG: TolC family protein [Myxococcales bacterium]|nr:TolC family protein [Myxococcales bacterium]